MPLCRWSWEILPHHQKVLVVHEPEYTHMFESILAGPEPHTYVHLRLPGGTSSLTNASYALRPGTEAPLQGTLMRIVAHLREADSRLVLVVQGLSRVAVLRPTQSLPYSRADVQRLPDLESLHAGARASRRWLRAANAMKHTDRATRARLALAAVHTEEDYWRAYLFANVSLVAHPTPKLALLNASAAEDVADAATRVPAVIAAGMKALLRARLQGAVDTLLAEENSGDALSSNDIDVIMEMLDTRFRTAAPGKIVESPMSVATSSPRSRCRFQCR